LGQKKDEKTLKSEELLIDIGSNSPVKGLKYAVCWVIALFDPDRFF
jgi:hypothetical protein